MIEYDFLTVIDRRGQGSAKWDDMIKANPDVPVGIIPLSVADMELKNPPEIMSGLREYFDVDKMTFGYTAPTDSYKEAVKGWMKRRHNWNVDMEWNLLSPGVVTAFFNAVRAFSEPGDGVIIFSPVYYPFKMALEVNDRVTVDIPLADRGGHYEIDWERFSSAASEPSNKLLLFCSPHNPVGRVWSEQELKKLSEICLANDVLVLSDEIHNDLIMPGYKHTVYATLSDKAAQNSVVFTSPSKTFSLAGLQTSNIFVPNTRLREKLASEMFKSAIFSLNTAGLKACEIAYTKCENWLEQIIKLIVSNAELVGNFIASEIPQIEVYPLEGTYLQWWDCRELFGDYREQEQFMRDKAYLFMDEGYMFGDTGKGFTRINLACPARVLQDALNRLKNALEKR